MMKGKREKGEEINKGKNEDLSLNDYVGENV